MQQLCSQLSWPCPPKCETRWSCRRKTCYAAQERDCSWGLRSCLPRWVGSQMCTLHTLVPLFRARKSCFYLGKYVLGNIGTAEHMFELLPDELSLRIAGAEVRATYCCRALQLTGGESHPADGANLREAKCRLHPCCGWSYRPRGWCLLTKVGVRCAGSYQDFWPAVPQVGSLFRERFQWAKPAYNLSV